MKRTPVSPACRNLRRVASLALLAAAGAGTTAWAGDLPPLKQRRAAAEQTANSETNPCFGIRPFYWEVGNKNERQAGGSLTTPDGPFYDASTVLSIASASKWIYGAYAVQKLGGVLSDSDIEFLHFRSGYTSFQICRQTDTIDSCLDFLDNGEYRAWTADKYFYNGGHMQKHAQMMGLGSMNNAALAAEMRSQLGTDIQLAYSQPQPPGGVVTNADNYARFLRKILTGELLMKGKLGKHAVCTNPDACDKALATPIPPELKWHYSIGHWVEDDKHQGDGAFSCAGAFGFYPWIDADRKTYGLISRRDDAGTGIESHYCGRLIRKAFLTGIPQ